jgi:hypothetical protein
MGSLTFIREEAAAWWGKFECPNECPHDDLRRFCRKHCYTDCFGAFMRFLLSEED